MMATAEEILAASRSTDSADDGNHLRVSEDLRTITVPTGQEVLGVFCDADVRRLWFDMPARCDGVDLSGFDIYVNYRNAAGELDRYTVTDAVVEGGVMTFSWLVSRRAFELEGDVEFSVCLMEHADDGITVTREFNTTTATMVVLAGLEAMEISPAPYADAVASQINAWWLLVSAAISECESAKESLVEAAAEFLEGSGKRLFATAEDIYAHFGAADVDSLVPDGEVADDADVRAALSGASFDPNGFIVSDDMIAEDDEIRRYLAI